MPLTVWVWVTVAVVMLVGEVLSPGFFLLPFGVGAVCSAVIAASGGSPEWQWIAFVGVSSTLMIILQRLVAARRRKK